MGNINKSLRLGSRIQDRVKWKIIHKILNKMI